MANTKVRSVRLGIWNYSLTVTGTWVPLEQGEALAQRNNVYEKLRTIFEFHPGNISPPPAPKHTTAKPKPQKKILSFADKKRLAEEQMAQRHGNSGDKKLEFL